MDRQQLKKRALNLALRPLRRAHGVTYRLIARVEYALGALRGPGKSFTRLPPTRIKDPSQYCALKGDVSDADVFIVAKMHRRASLERDTSFVNDASYRSLLADIGISNPGVTHQLATVANDPLECRFTFENPEYFAGLPDAPTPQEVAESPFQTDPKAN